MYVCMYVLCIYGRYFVVSSLNCSISRAACTICSDKKQLSKYKQIYLCFTTYYFRYFILYFQSSNVFWKFELLILKRRNKVTTITWKIIMVILGNVKRHFFELSVTNKYYILNTLRDNRLVIRFVFRKLFTFYLTTSYISDK